MKKLTLLFAMFSLLAACGNNAELTDADKDALDENPELEDVRGVWDDMVSAADADDCDALLENTRSSLGLNQANCNDALTYFKDAPTVDWARSEFSSSKDKVKLYELEGGSIGSFVYDEDDNAWQADETFWN